MSLNKIDYSLSKVTYGHTECVALATNNLRRINLLHGPSMFAVKAKIYGVLYNPASLIDFDETSSYWSAPKSS